MKFFVFLLMFFALIFVLGGIGSCTLSSLSSSDVSGLVSILIGVVLFLTAIVAAGLQGVLAMLREIKDKVSQQAVPSSTSAGSPPGPDVG